MHGIPEKERLMGFVGRDLIQICFGSHQVIFNFDDNMRISVESSIEHSVPGEGVRCYKKFWNQETYLTKLLGHTVSGLNVIDGKRLDLKFSNGHSIGLKDDSEEYECFQIEMRDDLIIV